MPEAKEVCVCVGGATNSLFLGGESIITIFINITLL